jgi:outer membrane autotransporter protein
VKTRYSGVAVGWDYSPTNNSRVGVAVAGEPGRFSVDNLATFGKVQSTIVGVYGSIWGGPWSARFDLAYGDNHDSYNRTIGALGSAEKAHGALAGDSWSGHAEAGRTFTYGFGYVRPFVAFDAARIDLNAYQETPGIGASGVFDLAFQARHVDSDRSSLGAEAATRWALNPTLELRPFVRAAWVHEFASTDRSTRAAFETAPGFDFEQQGARGLGDSGRIDMGAVLSGMSKLDLEVRAGTIAADRFQGFDGEVGLKWRW